MMYLCETKAKKLKNKDLIKKLQELDPESDVVIYDDCSEGGGTAFKIRLGTFDNSPSMKGVTFEEVNSKLTQPFIIIYGK